MKAIAIIATLMIVISCNNTTTTTATSESSTAKLPEKPGSIEAVHATLKGKSYKTINAGTVSPFEMDKDNPYEWQDKLQDTSAKKYLSENMAFKLNFLNDSSVTVFDDGEEKQGTYRVDTTATEDYPTGTKLKLSYMSSMFGTVPSLLTFTYLVNGINDKQLFLQTPREVNNRKVVVLMEAK